MYSSLCPRLFEARLRLRCRASAAAPAAAMSRPRPWPRPPLRLVGARSGAARLLALVAVAVCVLWLHGLCAFAAGRSFAGDIVRPRRCPRGHLISAATLQASAAAQDVEEAVGAPAAAPDAAPPVIEGEDEAIPGLLTLLRHLKIPQHYEATNKWVEEQGFYALAEVVHGVGKLAMILGLDPEETQRLKRSAAIAIQASGATKQTFDDGKPKPEWAMPLANPRPALGEVVPGLRIWLARLELVEHLEAANSWCTEMGALVLGEVVENIEDLAEALELAPEESKRLQAQGQRALTALEWRGDLASQPAVRPAEDLVGGTRIRKTR